MKRESECKDKIIWQVLKIHFCIFHTCYQFLVIMKDMNKTIHHNVSLNRPTNHLLISVLSFLPLLCGMLVFALLLQAIFHDFIKLIGLKGKLLDLVHAVQRLNKENLLV